VGNRNDENSLFFESENYRKRIPAKQDSMSAMDVLQERVRRALDLGNRCVEFSGEGYCGSRTSLRVVARSLLGLR